MAIVAYHCRLLVGSIVSCIDVMVHLLIIDDGTDLTSVYIANWLPVLLNHLATIIAIHFQMLLLYHIKNCVFSSISCKET